MLLLQKGTEGACCEAQERIVRASRKLVLVLGRKEKADSKKKMETFWLDWCVVGSLPHKRTEEKRHLPFASKSRSLFPPSLALSSENASLCAREGSD